MKIKISKKIQIVIAFLVGLGLGLIDYTKVFYHINNPDTLSIVSMGGDYSNIKINSTDTKTYINNKYGFEIVYPKDFTIVKEENTECSKSSYVNSEQISNPVDIQLKEGSIINIIPLVFNTPGTEDHVFSGSIGYKYLSDCNPSRFISIEVHKKRSDLDSYLNGIVSFHKNRNEELGIKNSEEEGPFRLIEKIDGKDVHMLRFKAGNELMDWVDIYYFENENYIYSLTHLYNQKNLISPDTQDNYIEQLRNYELALRVIEGFSLQEENKK